MLGFRDNFNELKKDGFKVQIPTCVQLEPTTDDETKDDIAEKNIKKNKEKCLSTLQTANTRLVTKVIISF